MIIWINQHCAFLMTVNTLIELLMNEQDIEMFMKAFDDFMEHSKEFKQREYERKAAELEVTVDYYMQEFM